MLSLLSVFLFFEGPLYGIILLGVALELALRKGIELDLDEKKYRNIYSIFAINFGRWKELPETEYISVFKTIKNTRSRVITAEATLGFQVFKVNLFYNRNKHIEVYISDEIEDAFSIAKHIATVLDVDILDATTPEKEWIKLLHTSNFITISVQNKFISNFLPRNKHTNGRI